MVGIFDSGLGGLSALKEFSQIMPKEDIVYFGDTGRVPYGSRSTEMICHYAKQDTRFLLTHPVKAILCACGTVSSVALQTLRREFPDVLIFGVIEGAAKRAAACTKNKKVGIIGTATTIQSGAYVNAITHIDPEIQTISTACPLLVSLVENNFISPDDEITCLAAKRYLQDIVNFGADTLILGCTHFPILMPVFKKILPGVTMISSGKEAAAELADALTPSLTESGRIQYYVSDEMHNFNAVATVFLGHEIGNQIQKIDIESYKE